ncbi:MAG: hypothetical protein Q8K65_06200 [Alphaproteobacteria bacterium]|nr:hypothetical protein [Alphaproteobacteria bacterium]
MAVEKARAREQAAAAEAGDAIGRLISAISDARLRAIIGQKIAEHFCDNCGDRTPRAACSCRRDD